jgi:hypothetical protein
MLSEQKTTDNILEITMTIREHHPELSKYLNEMGITLPDVANPVMTHKVLQEYYNSLQALLNTYKPHP